MKILKGTAKFTLVLALALALAVQPFAAMAQAEEHTHDETCGYNDGACLVLEEATEVVERGYCTGVGNEGGECVPGPVSGSNTSGHERKCSLSGCSYIASFEPHNKSKTYISKEPTETETGIRTYACSVCNYVMDTEVLPVKDHKHEFSNWSNDDSEHWKECTCGLESERASHIEDQGTITVEPTATTNGKREFRCVACGLLMRTETIVDHDCTFEWKFNDSTHWEECTTCGIANMAQYHIEDTVGTITKEPTIMEPGERTYKCICGYVYRTEEVPIIPHEHTHDDVLKYDTEEHWYECVHCGVKMNKVFHVFTNIIYMDGRESHGEWTIDDTHHWNECQRCDYKVRHEAHAPGDKRTFDDMNHWQLCSICNKQYAVEIHDLVTSVVQANENSSIGSVVFNCSKCDYSKGPMVCSLTDGYPNFNGWYQTFVGGKRQWLYCKDGQPLLSQWVEYKGGRYYLKEDGTLAIGWILLEETQSDGTIKKVYYYMDADGRAQTGWVKWNGKWYLTDNNGHMLTGWQKVGGLWYYLDKDGAMQTGWIKLDGVWYYSNAHGQLQTGWIYWNGKWYYSNAHGQLQTGWIYWNGGWYYANEDGQLLTGWLGDGLGNKYYANAAGRIQTGFFRAANGYLYYANEKGQLQTGTFKIDGVWYITDQYDRVRRLS